MTYDRKKHYNCLELPKVLELLADLTCCEDAREFSLSIEPQTNLSLAKALLAQTRDAHMLLARFGGPSFGGLKNVDGALSRAAAGSTLSMKELLDVAGVLRAIRSVFSYRETNGGDDTVLDVFFGSLRPNSFLETSITSAIISEDEMSDNASPALAKIRRDIRIKESSVREKLEKLVRSNSQKYLQENIITMRNGRYVVPVKNEYRSEIAGLVHDTSSSGATVFIEPVAVVEANNDIKILRSDEVDEMERILAQLSSDVGDFAETIKSSYECAVELNVIFSKAQLAYKMKATFPEFNDNGIIDLKQARHPLIDPKKVVPVDIRLGEEFDTLVITGPNTGGKTVAIKTIGLLTLMAMCGLMLPVNDKSRISVFDHVLADIGDEQSIEQSLSTFSSHMTNIIEMQKIADEKSLVLIDELGAGTDPVEGAALATAILEDLHFKGSKIAATTHYAELKIYALESPRIENGSCEFDVSTLRPTYRLLIGIPGKSNAFAISEKLGMEKHIVERGEELVSSESKAFENVVDKLESTRKSLETELNKADDELRKAQAMKEQAQEELQRIEKLRKNELDAAKNSATKIVEQAKREAYAMLEELEKLKKEQKSKNADELLRQARAAVKKGVDSLYDAADPVVTRFESDENYVLPRPLLPGDSVLIYDINETATVVSVDEKKKTAEVLAGSLKTRVKISNLRLLDKKPKPKNDKPRNVSSSSFENRRDSKAETKVDLRGMTADEAIDTLDKYIDTAYRLGIGEFTVVHGKGTGVLRKAVNQYLRSNSYIKSYRLGVYGEGEDGVTIVTLR
ncbi:MAG: endonuclease MutS2 [Clostridia bacterium]|nr:endonuclease MutS2 [Clostridia bacterium]